VNQSYLSYTEELPVPQRPYQLPDAIRAVYRQALCVAVVFVPVAVVAGPFPPTAGNMLMIAVATAIWVISLHASDRGPGPSALALGTCVVVAFRTLSGLAALSVLVLWVPSLNADAPELLAMAGGVFLASWALGANLQASGAPRRLVLVGADDGVRRVAREVWEDDRLPFDVVGIVGDEPGEPVGDVRMLGGIRELGDIVRETNADLVVLGAGTSRAAVLSQMLDLDTLDVRVLDVHHFSEHAFGKVEVDQLSPEWFMGVLHLYQRPYSQLAKRIFDVIVASITLVITMPVIAGVCVAQRVAGGGPVFFRQLRLGEGGELFEIFKFRTMVETAETAGEAVWALDNDARITPIGRILRRTRLDELPQLWNVLRGEMSIVGPRPERPEFVDLLSTTVPFWTRRHLVKPGITGWAQIRRGYTADVDGTAEKLGYDLYYLKYRSLLFDLAIASRTVGIVLTGFGSR
jgi:exopolysaccharide biosynthesis polyprenyl glycosylphosphotransferase